MCTLSNDWPYCCPFVLIAAPCARVRSGIKPEKKLIQECVVSKMAASEFLAAVPSGKLHLEQLSVHEEIFTEQRFQVRGIMALGCHMAQK